MGTAKKILALVLTAALAFGLLSDRSLALSGVGDGTSPREWRTESTAEVTEPAEPETPAPTEMEAPTVPTEPETPPETTVPPTAPSLSRDDIIRISKNAAVQKTREEELLRASLLLAKRLARLAEMSNNTMAVCRTSGYVNVRNAGSTSGKLVGKIHNNAVATVLGKSYGSDGTWYHIQSGSVEGYVKSEFFVTGAEAVALYDQIVNRFVELNDGVETLRLRVAPNGNSNVLTVLNSDQRYSYVGEENGWTQIALSDLVSGYVASEYVRVVLDVNTAISLQEEQALLEQSRAIIREYEESLEASRQESIRQSIAESKRIESLIARSRAEEAASIAESIRQSIAESSRLASLAESSKAETGNYQQGEFVWIPPEGTSDLRKSICIKALSYVGVTPYVWGGNSLVTGVDCSGFTQQIFRLFGISIPRNSAAQGAYGIGVHSFADARPGDILHYDGHVAIYLGFVNGIPMMVHSPTEGQKVTVQRADYRHDLRSIRNVIGD